ncbi:dTDP-4-dehydrorhamnose reductase [soil metagenome]
MSTTPAANLYRSVLITGGAGMLAQAFAQVLIDRQIEFTTLRRADLDLTDATAVRAALAEHRPSLVLNCSAYTKVDLAEKEPALADAINGTAVGSLAKICKEFDAGLVHFSTDYVFNGTLSRPLRPEDPVGPRSAYGRSKLLGEKLLQENAPDRWLILRTAWLYGRGGPCFPATMVNAARAGKPLKVVEDQVGSPTYTLDLAAATLDLLDAGANGIFHVANSGQTNWREFAQAAVDEFGVSTPVAGITSADWKTLRPDSADRPSYSVFDLSPVERLLDRPMPTWRDALTRYRDAVTAAGSF